MEAILGNEKKIQSIIISELKDVIKKYAQPRRTLLLYQEDVKRYDAEETIEDYPVNLFFTQEGYFKKITPQSYRMSSDQYLKDGDKVITHVESTNSVNLLFFTDKGQVYKARACDFDDTKASALGDFIPAKLGMEEGENARFMVVTADYSGCLLFFFENGKVSKVGLKAYETKTNRKKLINAYNTKVGSPLAQVLAVTEDQEVMMTAEGGRILIFHSGVLLEKSTKDNQGVAVMTLKKGDAVKTACLYEEGMAEDPHHYMAKSLPSRGGIPQVEQATLD